MKILNIFICFILVFCVLNVSFAANKKQNLKQKLNVISKKISVTKNKIKQKKEEKREAYHDLREIDEKIEDYQTQIAHGQIGISKINNEIKALDSNIANIEKNLSRRESLLKKRVSDMYKGGDLQYINVLLDTTDMWSFLTQTYYLKKLIDYDTSLIENIKKDKAETIEKKQKRENKLKELKYSQDKIISLRNKQNTLAKNKKREIESIKDDIEKEERAYREELRSSAEIERQILAMQRTPQGKARLSRTFSGSLSLPCPGRITSRFGWRIHPIKKTRRFHTGVDLACHTGTPIHAAGSGVVILSGWNGVYGKAVIIDHGGGVTTLYGHCSSLSVRSGQTVSKGQTIGKVGSTGWSTGPHCHYEKRINGKPVQPL